MKTTERLTQNCMPHPKRKSKAWKRKHNPHYVVCGDFNSRIIIFQVRKPIQSHLAFSINYHTPFWKPCSFNS
ncbi:hypothetical protein VIGAN_01194300, partial [Vigna angularis var. angularis]